MRWRVQLGINSASGVWMFCKNWTSSHDCLFVISMMTKLEFVFKYLSAILFVFSWKIINCTAVQLMKSLYASKPISIR